MEDGSDTQSAAEGVGVRRRGADAMATDKIAGEATATDSPRQSMKR
jgi:hypothetical protein